MTSVPRALRTGYDVFPDKRRPVGDNPPSGAVIDYYLKSKPAQHEEITLEFLTADGTLIRRLSNHRPKDAFEQPAEWIDRYRGEFDAGWDQWRDATFARQHADGRETDLFAE